MALAVGDGALIAALVVAAFAGWSRIDGSTGRAGEGWGSLAGIEIVHIVAVLVVIAGVSRSSLVPLHRWLVTTIVAPTPVSALVHAGFVSGAGLLLIRFRDLFVASAPAVHLAFLVGAATVFVALGAQTTRVDVKGKLAWSTVAQMGFMVLQCAVGAFSSAAIHIAGHGMYKASLFLGAGDAVSARLRARRRPASGSGLTRRSRVIAAGVIATAATAIGFALLTPDVTDAGVILIGAFSWVTVANGVRGWLDRTPFGAFPALGAAAGGGIVAVVTYLGGLRLLEAFTKPSFTTLPPDAGVDPLVVIAVLAVALALAGAAVFRLGPFPQGAEPLRTVMERTAHPGLRSFRPVRRPPGDLGAAPPPVGDPPDGVRRALLQADVARAQTVVAPFWPLTSFVAVNPLGGFDHLSFDDACSTVRRYLHGRTHLTLESCRRDHERGLITTNDLRQAIAGYLFDHDKAGTVMLDGREVPIADVIEHDLLFGPDIDDEPQPLTPLEMREGVDGPVGKLIDTTLTHAVAQYVSGSSTSTGAAEFVRRWRHTAFSVGDLGRLVDDDVVGWLESLGEDRLHLLDASLRAAGVTGDQRVDALRRHLARLQGWAGYARWRTDWAGASEAAAPLSPVDLVAARSALEAAWLLSNPGTPVAPTAGPATDAQAERVAAVLKSLGAVEGMAESTADAHPEIADVIAGMEPARRTSLWLEAAELGFDRQLLTTLDRLDPGHRLDPPEAQLVFCIDVRSEGLRHQLEETGPYETLGFAGFFGVPMAVRRVEWTAPEARCPVLVAPSVTTVEHGRRSRDGGGTDEAHRLVESAGRAAGLHEVAAKAKNGLGAGFVTAEAAGWVTGPLAAARTFVPRRPRPVQPRPTTMTLDLSDAEQQVGLAEAVLRIMGLTQRFAPLVVLCGHASNNVNNPHATALDCGACAGASGEDNARAVAALLNDPAVRSGLAERGIGIPETTHFMPGLHETVSDRVSLLDLADVPASHRSVVDRLTTDLEVAAANQSRRRARDLPGRPASVQFRGNDWAQIRPEWGLARNAAFIIGPRSMTAGLDLDGRAFLHSYYADQDPDGGVLETIMTAPLVVAHWISSQYYFSTVDPEVFGAGDKLMHNVVGDIGVISGEHGDLRIGLPLQSTHCGVDRYHHPLRLVAVIQAPLERIEAVIQQNSILGTLTAGRWLRIVGRTHPHEQWSIRSPEGTWSAEPRPLEAIHAKEHL